MYQRDECIRQAGACREKTQSDPDRYHYWIEEVVIWLRRAIETRSDNAVTHEIDDGRMIPTRLH